MYSAYKSKESLGASVAKKMCFQRSSERIEGEDLVAIILHYNTCMLLQSRLRVSVVMLTVNVCYEFSDKVHSLFTRDGICVVI